ncbi:MAG: hypothetical protein ABL984_02570 [Pyrinomonadaceae bacterium]
MAGKHTKWPGWVRRADVDPELLAKIERYQERVKVHFRSGDTGTGNTIQAHRIAEEDVPLTAEEKRTLRYLESEIDWRFQRIDDEPKAQRPPFDARQWMLDRGIDPDIEVHLHISKGVLDDPEIRVWGTEYRNTVTGEIRFVETRRERVVKGIHYPVLQSISDGDQREN